VGGQSWPTCARVVIIGGGAVGVSALYHLAKAGWTDCVLLEKNELTAGSTWHAAGNVPTFSTSWSIMNMQRYSTELYRGLGEAVDYPMNYHVTGSIRLGHSEERMQEFARARGMGLPGHEPRDPRARRDQGPLSLHRDP
jgi:dimethylglycine dehydrogenase